MSDLLNSNDTAPSDYLYIPLGASLALPALLFVAYNTNKKLLTKNPQIIYWTLIVSCLLFSIWVALYLAAWLAVYYPIDENNPYGEVDKNYASTCLGFLVVPLTLLLGLTILKQFNYFKNTFSENLFTAIIFTIICYTLIGISYYLNLAARNNGGFPLSSTHFTGKANYFQDNKDVFRYGYFALIVPIVSYGLLKAYNRNWGNMRNKLNEKFLEYLTFFSGVIMLLYIIITESFIAIPDTAGPENEYSIYLIISNFSIIALIFSSLITIAMTKYIERNDKNNFYNILVLVFSSIALIWSSVNTGFTLNQNVSNANFRGEDKLKNGTNIKDYNENSYNLLNFAMGYNNFGLVLLSLFIVIFSGLSLFSSTTTKKRLSKLSNFFSGQIKFSYDWWSILLLIGVLVEVGLSIFFGIYFGDDDKDAFIKDEGGVESGWFPIYTTCAVIILSYLLENFSNIGVSKDNESTFVLKILHYLFLAFFLIIPVVSAGCYLATLPKFYNRVFTNSNEEDLIFGDIKDNNAISDLDGSEGESIFKVSSNFVSSGNGLMITGGRTSLDLATTRNIRYVDNQADYYNSKYKYAGQDFKEITNNDLNIFTLQTNQISYGNNDNDNSKAYWVAAGENVGLGDCLYYNLTAGANNNENIPEISEFNKWTVADSGAFNYKANGVISGAISGNNRWVAVGQNNVDFSGTSNIKYSNNGRDWLNATGVSFSGYGNKVAFGPAGLSISSGYKSDNTYIAVGYDTSGVSTILRSTDGIDWSSTTNNFDGQGKDVVYGMSSNGTSAIWVAVGEDTTYPVKYSIDDGQTWNNAATSFDFTKPDDANTVAYNLTDKLFYVGGKKGNTNVVYSSGNGNNWTAETKYQKFDEITSIGYNLLNSKSNNNFNNVYYPAADNQQFFVDKLESESLRYFLLGTYGATFLLILMTFLIMYYTTKDPALK